MGKRKQSSSGERFPWSMVVVVVVLAHLSCRRSLSLLTFLLFTCQRHACLSTVSFSVVSIISSHPRITKVSSLPTIPDLTRKVYHSRDTFWPLSIGVFFIFFFSVSSRLSPFALCFASCNKDCYTVVGQKAWLQGPHLPPPLSHNYNSLFFPVPRSNSVRPLRPTLIPSSRPHDGFCCRPKDGATRATAGGVNQQVR
jgi:hypothetical protein